MWWQANDVMEIDFGISCTWGFLHLDVFEVFNVSGRGSAQHAHGLAIKYGSGPQKDRIRSMMPN